jgi:hypothetical protein
MWQFCAKKKKKKAKRDVKDKKRGSRYEYVASACPKWFFFSS